MQKIVTLCNTECMLCNQNKFQGDILNIVYSNVNSSSVIIKKIIFSFYRSG